MKNRVLFIALLIMAILAQPMYAAKPKKSSKRPPKLEQVDKKLYSAGKETIQRKDLLNFYAQQNCQQAYDQFKKGRNCVISGWVLLGVGSGMAVAGLGCIIGGIVGTVTSVVNTGSELAYGNTDVGTGEIEKNFDLITAGGVMLAIGPVMQIASIPCLSIGYRKMKESVSVYNIECAKVKAQAQPYWSIQTSNNGLGFAFNF